MDRKEIKMKAFDLEKVRNGRQVYTRDGHKVQILDYNYKCHYFSNNVPRCTIVGKVRIDEETEELRVWSLDGFIHESKEPDRFDLVMIGEPHEGWVNIYNDENYECGQGICLSKEIAEAKGKEYGSYVATVKVSWEE